MPNDRRHRKPSKSRKVHFAQGYKGPLFGDDPTTAPARHAVRPHDRGTRTHPPAPTKPHRDKATRARDSRRAALERSTPVDWDRYYEHYPRVCLCGEDKTLIKRYMSDADICKPETGEEYLPVSVSVWECERCDT